MTNITELPTTLSQAKQSALNTLQEALEDARARGLQWCVIVGETDEGVMRRWSGYANAASVIGGLELVKHAILEDFEGASQK